jgi:hypothetical protein
MSNRILSYRGLLAEAGQDTILLTTKKGEVGYKIIKFQLFPYKPGWAEFESLVQIWKEEQDGIPTTEAKSDFNNNRLLAASLFSATATTANSPNSITTIFGNEIFNQDIYVTHTQQSGAESINYYIELEIIKLTEDQAMVATLKDIRNNSTD